MVHYDFANVLPVFKWNVCDIQCVMQFRLNRALIIVIVLADNKIMA